MSLISDSEQLVEKRISSKEIFDGRLLHVFFDEARLPDGSESTREWIKHPGASAVLPVFRDGDVMLVKQFRYPVAQIFYEVPAGKIDPGETADSTARRELKEEAGLTCQQFHYLGNFYPSIGYTDEIIHLYIAWEIEEFEQTVDEDEFLVKERVPFREAVEMAHTGEISDGKTAITLLRAWKWWQKEGPFEV
ncbi:NUDIX domain-containing protein [Halalkalibaculum sp. DA3122]|uniref:NUDIX domain-containing protein n=1 Tax=unclassified Halalkalibaculum TaxID=2964617 RepID=UPI003754F8DC